MYYIRPFRDCLSENQPQVIHTISPNQKISASIVAKPKPLVRFTKTERFWIDLKRDKLLSEKPLELYTKLADY